MRTVGRLKRLFLAQARRPQRAGSRRMVTKHDLGGCETSANKLVPLALSLPEINNTEGAVGRKLNVSKAPNRGR